MSTTDLDNLDSNDDDNLNDDSNNNSIPKKTKKENIYNILNEDTNVKDGKDVKDDDNIFYNFFESLSFYLLEFLIILLIGAIALYSAKVGQANIIPTCMPFNNLQSPPPEIPINLNTMNDASQKIFFSMAENNSHNQVLAFLTKLNNAPLSSAFSKYFMNILLKMFQKISQFYNAWCNIQNSYMSESAIILCSILLLPIIVAIMFIYGFLLFIWYAATTLSTLMTMNINTNPNGVADWAKIIMIMHPSKYMKAMFVAFIAIICVFAGLGLLPLILIGILLTVIITPLTYIGKVNEQSYSFINLIQDIINFKKFIIIAGLALIAIITSFVTLGNIVGVLILGIICFLSFAYGISYIFSDNTQMMNNLNFSPLSSFEQAMKTCNRVSPFATNKFVDIIKNIADYI
ncbi:hypothetical protein N8459_02480 [Nitrosopumilus sp.]|nr:hypothetical protein [Nitrosopumilus sp.]